ncbi:hypothetical protein HZH66_003820 [Vespula vulgaris]|uniref:Uncharacterized protein n=1 Tax=Vespula vulgaris TaxID=7454 RepID=A0A834NE97_VESVU|nr:hypothetical protein HZH66_003820 [Vespula vulgaris]
MKVNWATSPGNQPKQDTSIPDESQVAEFKVTTWVDNENATDCGLLTAASRKVEIINLRFKLTHMQRALISEYSSLTTPLITHLIEYYGTAGDLYSIVGVIFSG